MARPALPEAFAFAKIVYRLTTEPRGWRVDQLQGELGIEDRTYRKYRKALQDHFEPFQENGKSRVVDEKDEAGNHWLRLRASGAEKEQDVLGRAAALIMAKETLRFLGGTSAGKAAEELGARLAKSTGPRPELRRLAERMPGLIHVVPDAPKRAAVKPEVLDSLLSALVEAKSVVFSYREFKGTPEKLVEASPHWLAVWRSGLYLVAQPKGELEARLYAVERITKAEKGKRKAARATRKPGEFFAGAFGIFLERERRGRIVELLFADDKYLKRYVSERVWHATQKISEEPDGRLRLKFRVESLEEVAPWIRSFGAAVEVVSPKDDLSKHGLGAATARRRRSAKSTNKP